MNLTTSLLLLPASWLTMARSTELGRGRIGLNAARPRRAQLSGLKQPWNARERQLVAAGDIPAQETRATLNKVNTAGALRVVST